MKQNKISFAMLLVLAISIFSCKKDETKAYLKNGTAVNLTANKTTLVLDSAASANNTDAITFSWNKADFGFAAGTVYTLEMTKSTGGNWLPSNSAVLDMGTSLTKTFKMKELNAELVKFLNPFVATSTDIRIKASAGGSAAPQYSNVVKVTFTPYKQLIKYAFPASMNIAGGFQSWDPGTAPQIVDIGAMPGGNYDGYIDFGASGSDFKMVRGNAWSAGDHGYGGTAGTLTANGGPNLNVSSGGIWRLTANRNNLTYSATKINGWALIGDATPGGWGTETPMTYDPASKLYSVTLNLNSSGKFKFRANNDWAINFGDTGNDGSLEYGGGDIPVAATGNYTITLDIMIAGNYAYTVKKN